jgi:hypothetical protein
MTAGRLPREEARPQSDTLGSDRSVLTDASAPIGSDRPLERASAERRRALAQYLRALRALSRDAPVRPKR